MAYLTRDGSAWTPEYLTVIDASKCIGCGHCYKVCSREVMHLQGVIVFDLGGHTRLQGGLPLGGARIAGNEYEHQTAQGEGDQRGHDNRMAHHGPHSYGCRSAVRRKLGCVESRGQPLLLAEVARPVPEARPSNPGRSVTTLQLSLRILS